MPSGTLYCGCGLAEHKAVMGHLPAAQSYLALKTPLLVISIKWELGLTEYICCVANRLLPCTSLSPSVKNSRSLNLEKRHQL